MLLLKKLKEFKEEIIELHKIKNFDSREIIDNILALDEDRKKNQKQSVIMYVQPPLRLLDGMELVEIVEH